MVSQSGHAIKIQATSSPSSADFLPQSEWVTYEFAARGTMPAVKVTWCDGGLRPPRPEGLEPGRAIRDATYIGDKGIIMHASHGAVPELVPADASFKVLHHGYLEQVISMRTGLVPSRLVRNHATTSHGQQKLPR